MPVQRRAHRPTADIDVSPDHPDSRGASLQTQRGRRDRWHRAACDFLPRLDDGLAGPFLDRRVDRDSALSNVGQYAGEAQMDEYDRVTDVLGIRRGSAHAFD